jgi:hypothetical protein
MKPRHRCFWLLVLVAVAPACGGGGGGKPRINTPPTAVVTTPTGVQTGIIPVAYALSDPETNAAGIVAEWSSDGGVTWSPATRSFLGGDSTTGLTTSHAGTPHVYWWDSASDGVGRNAAVAIRFRITPSDVVVGTPGTADFTVDNRVTCFRLDTFVLRDPHIFLNFIACVDVTSSNGGIPGVPAGGVNSLLQTALTTDGDGDGFLDAAPILLFRLFDQAAASGAVEVASGRFAAASPDTGDLQAGTPRAPTTMTNVAAGTILAPLPGTTKPYAPAITTPSGPGFLTAPVSYTVTVGAITLPLEGFQLAATYSGNPATGLTNGLAMGFLSESTAQSTMVDLGALGTVPIASLLAGGQGGCSGSEDDRDNGPDGHTSGWWIYFNFTAHVVTYTGP